MKRKNYFTYILTIVTIILLNITSKVYSKNIDQLYEKIDLFSEVLEKIQSDYVWMDRNWPIQFFDWMKDEKLDTKLSGMIQMNNKLKLEFIDGKSATLFGLKYDKQKIF